MPKKPTMITPEARLDFNALFEPAEDLNGRMKYSAVLLFPKGTDLTALEELAKDAFTERFPKAPMKGPNFHWPFKDGAEKDRPGYGSGIVVLKVSSDYAPGVVAAEADPATGRPRVITDPSEVYPGCWVRCSVTVSPWEYANKRGVSFHLRNLQKLRDDIRFGGSGRAEDEFDVIMQGTIEMEECPFP